MAAIAAKMNQTRNAQRQQWVAMLLASLLVHAVIHLLAFPAMALGLWRALVGWYVPVPVSWAVAVASSVYLYLLVTMSIWSHTKHEATDRGSGSEFGYLSGLLLVCGLAWIHAGVRLWIE